MDETAVTEEFYRLDPVFYRVDPVDPFYRVPIESAKKRFVNVYRVDPMDPVSLREKPEAFLGPRPGGPEHQELYVPPSPPLPPPPPPPAARPVAFPSVTAVSW